MRKKLILITGMSGSGKTTLAEYFKESGYTVVTMGDVIREMASKRKIEPTPANLGRIAEEIRMREGKGAVARRCVEKVKRESLGRVAVDGIRSLDEVDVFREVLDVALVAIHSSPRTRFNRLSARGRSDDAMDEKVFRERDVRELGFGLGNAIAMADHIIVNEGSLDDFRAAFKELVERLEDT